MVDYLRGFSSFMDDSPSESAIMEQCEKLLSLPKGQSKSKDVFNQLLEKNNMKFDLANTFDECVAQLMSLAKTSNGSNTTLKYQEETYNTKHSRSLIIFVILIATVSIISIFGNLCLAKVLYSKRYRLIQTDRIVLCLALSELCLVLIDTPAEIYRFLSYSFTQEWLCRFHTFFEALFSSCIIFYHLLGAFDRFVYIHGHTSSESTSWSKWCRRISSKSGSIILLILPIICSIPISVCNSLHAHIFFTPIKTNICMVQYTHGILISILISFYILPLLFSFFLHAKLIYFIRTRHDHHYLTPTAYMLPMKRNNITEFQSKKRSNKEQSYHHDQLLSKPKHSLQRRFIMFNTETIGSTTTTTMAHNRQSPPLHKNMNNSSNSSQSSRSSTATSSASITSPVVLYKINSQANANANRAVLLLVLLLSFYVFCWAPHNIYTWHRVYKLTESPLPNHTTNDSPHSNDTSSVNDELRRFIFINYSLYLLSTISMCFSFLFYFSLNKQARHELSRLMGCICPGLIHITTEQKKGKEERSGRIHYRARFQNQHRNPASPPSLRNNRYTHKEQMNSPRENTSKRTVLNYGCQIQCCV